MKATLLGLALVVLLASPVSAMSCIRSIPQGDPSKRCTDADIDHGRRGCTAADCGFGPNDCNVDWAPICSGVELDRTGVCAACTPDGSASADGNGTATEPN